MDQAPWEFHKSSEFQLPRAVCASLLFHILLALVLTVPPTTPQVGSDGRFAISWVAPAAAVPPPAVTQKPAREGPETPVAPAQPVPARPPNATLGPKEPSDAGPIEVFLVAALRQPAPTAATPPAQKTHVHRPTQRVAPTAPRPPGQRAQTRPRQEPVRIKNRQPGRQARPAPRQLPPPAQLAQARSRVTLQLPPAAQQDALQEEQEDEEPDATPDEDPAQTEAPEPELAGLDPSRVSGPSQTGELALSKAAALPPRRLPKPVLSPASPSPPARPMPPADTSQTVAAASQPKSPERGRENTGSKGARVAALDRRTSKQRQPPAPPPPPSRPATRPQEPLTPPSPGVAPRPVLGRATFGVAATPTTRVAQEPSAQSRARAGTGVAKPEPAGGTKAASKVTVAQASPASSGDPGAAPSVSTDKTAAKSTAKAAAVSTTKPAKPAVPRTKQAAARKAQPAPSTPAALPSLHGDLKLVLTGNPDLKVTVKFRDYPRSRRNATPAGSEARREALMTPLVVATGATTREAVIGSTQEGVYSFIVEPLHGKSSRASFKLKIYEASPRERSVSLGNRAVTGPTVLLKILIPEAVLWDEEAPFTGSMEDSESETKFNADNGLFWKEFKP